MATGPLGAARSDPPMTTGQAPPRRRAYRSPRRQQQAAETRAAVLAAAVQLFGERGWAATGMREVARAAGVSVETVYAGFGSKSDLLLAALDVAPADRRRRPADHRRPSAHHRAVPGAAGGRGLRPRPGAAAS